MRGCDPKKMLIAATSVVDHVHRMRGHGTAGDVRNEWSKLMAFKRWSMTVVRMASPCVLTLSILPDPTRSGKECGSFGCDSTVFLERSALRLLP